MSGGPPDTKEVGDMAKPPYSNDISLDDVWSAHGITKVTIIKALRE
jgi:hypothetical protein